MKRILILLLILPLLMACSSDEEGEVNKNGIQLLGTTWVSISEPIGSCVFTSTLTFDKSGYSFQSIPECSEGSADKYFEKGKYEYDHPNIKLINELTMEKSTGAVSENSITIGDIVYNKVK